MRVRAPGCYRSRYIRFLPVVRVTRSLGKNMSAIIDDMVVYRDGKVYLPVRMRDGTIVHVRLREVAADTDDSDNESIASSMDHVSSTHGDGDTLDDERNPPEYRTGRSSCCCTIL